jgi:hypothetical protein
VTALVGALRYGVNIDEIFDRVRAMIADRNTSELDRRALEAVLRMAQRGRHISSSRMPAVSTAVQNFVAAREELALGRLSAGQQRLQQGLEAIGRPTGPEPDDEER